MDPRVIAPAEILRLNTKLYRNCLHGMTAAQAQARPADHANSAAFVALHLVDSRYFLLKLLGADATNPLPAELATARSIDDVKQWPAHADLEAAWTAASHALRDQLTAMTADQLNAAVTVRFPAPEQTVFGALTFLVQHESYHLGQLSLLRKQAGLPAMSYTNP